MNTALPDAGLPSDMLRDGLQRAGCVPVLLGPPFHAMPIPELVDWRQAAVIVHVADPSKWMDWGAKWALERKVSAKEDKSHPKWWTPEARLC